MLIKELLPSVRLHGRTVYDEEKNALFIDWSCAGFSIGVRGTYLKVKTVAESDQIPGLPGMPVPPPDWPCIGLVKNDELIYRHECHDEEELVLWQAEEKEECELRIVKVSENARGKLGIVEIETDGEFYEADKSVKKTIEFVGDSITCGFGNEAPNNAFEFKTSEENGWITYGALAARKLGYEWSMVCESGIAAIKPEHPFMPMHAMEDIYEYTDELYDRKNERPLKKWDFIKNHNDIVVLNLGTNDATPIRFYKELDEIEPMGEWFQKRFKEFVKQVRKANGPDTFICCTLGSIDYYLYHHIIDAVKELKEEGDEKLCCFAYLPINMMTEGYGAAGHPSAKTHARMAKELAYFIKKYVPGA